MLAYVRRGSVESDDGLYFRKVELVLEYLLNRIGWIEWCVAHSFIIPTVFANKKTQDNLAVFLRIDMEDATISIARFKITILVEDIIGREELLVIGDDTMSVVKPKGGVAKRLTHLFIVRHGTNEDGAFGRTVGKLANLVYVDELFVHESLTEKQVVWRVASEGQLGKDNQIMTARVLQNDFADLGKVAFEVTYDGIKLGEENFHGLGG